MLGRYAAERRVRQIGEAAATSAWKAVGTASEMRPRAASSVGLLFTPHQPHPHRIRSLRRGQVGKEAHATAGWKNSGRPFSCVKGRATTPRTAIRTTHGSTVSGICSKRSARCPSSRPLFPRHLARRRIISPTPRVSSLQSACRHHPILRRLF